MPSNSVSISYGGFSVGGASSTYLLNGPYVIEKSFAKLRVVAEVIVKGGTVGGLQSASEALEQAFTKRDQDLTISVGGASWDYQFGDTALNTTASLAKTGNPETNLGASRAYTISIEADLPSTDTDGLREIEVGVQFAATRQKTVTMRGAYTSVNGSNAVQKYLSEFDSEANTILSVIDNQAVWELVDENYSRDRNTHICTFQRQYLQLLADQSQQGRDDDQIKDHRMVFTDMSQFPGDGLQDVYRLRRVAGTYSCAVNIEETEDLLQVYREKVRPHIVDLFQTNFEPTVFAIEDNRVSYDETAKRMDVALQIIYSKAENGEGVIEVSQSVAIHETRTIDYTPIHEQDEYVAFADAGWAVRERVWNRTVVCLGAETPKARIGQRATPGNADLFPAMNGQTSVDQRNSGKAEREGWNIVSNTSQATSQWIGDPESESGAQFQVTTLTENVVERFHVKPGGGTIGQTTQSGGF